MTINQKLEYERIIRGMTQQEFSEFLGVSRGTISHHLTGRNISLRHLKNYSEKLKIDLLVEYAAMKIKEEN